jgi:hypothetical protein
MECRSTQTSKPIEIAIERHFEKARRNYAATIGAGEGNRTLVFSLEGCCSTIELHPRSCYIAGLGKPHRRIRGDPRGAEPIRQVRALSKRCPGSLRMRSAGGSPSESLEILCWGLSGKRVVLIPPRRGLPPVEFCRGTRPSHAANSLTIMINPAKTERRDEAKLGQMSA